MATFKPTVKHLRKDGLYQVYVRVVHNTAPGYIKTDKLVKPENVTKKGEITDPYVNAYCAQLILEWADKLNRIDIRAWTVQQVIGFIKEGTTDMSFSEYARKHIDRMIDRGQVRNSQSYKLATENLERFMGTNKLTFSALTSKAIGDWIESLGHTARAKEHYPICVRQIFREAMKELNDYDTGNVRIPNNPWLKVQIPKADKPEKKAITAEACRAFFSAPLPDTKMREPLPELGRDVAKMILCLAGINTADLYELRKEECRPGVICYERQKTRKARADNAYIEMRIEPILTELMEKYATEPDDPYLLNFHTRFCDLDSFNANVNTGIKAVCKSMGMPKEQWYSAYTFRHTWGTIAQNDIEASIAEVGFAMNHSQRLTVTRGYLRIDFSPAWELNRKVIDFVFFTNKPSKLFAKTSGHDAPEAGEQGLFRISELKLVKGTAFYMGNVVAEVHDTGFNNGEEVIAHLVPQLPAEIPMKATVQFRIENCDNGQVVVYERTKGKGF